MPIYRGIEVTGFAQDDTGVDVALSDGRSLRAQYLVGCDGGRSLIRKAAGIAFPGSDPTISNLIAEAETGRGRRNGASTATPSASMPSAGWSTRSATARWSTWIEGRSGHGDRTARRSHRRTHPARSQRGAHRRLRDRLRDPQSDLDFADSPTWPGRQLPTARDGCCWPATPHTCITRWADRASTLGVQDAVNLGWKLAQVVKKTSPESLLDTYHAERHPVAARVLRNTMAQVALLRTDDRTNALRETIVRAAGHGRAAQTVRR